MGWSLVLSTIVHGGPCTKTVFSLSILNKGFCLLNVLLEFIVIVILVGRLACNCVNFVFVLVFGRSTIRLACNCIDTAGVENAVEQLQPHDGEDDDEEHDEQHDVEQGDHRHDDRVDDNL